MKKSLILLIVAIIIGIAIFTVDNYTTVNSNTTNSIKINPNAVKTKALDFKLKDLQGNELSLSDLKGKKVFLNFWATWCGPCKSEMPEIEKLYQETKDTDLVIVTIEIGEPLNTVKSFIDSKKYKFKVLLDSDKSISSKYNISSIPTSYFIDVDGNIISKSVSAMNIDDMKAYIETLNK